MSDRRVVKATLAAALLLLAFSLAPPPLAAQQATLNETVEVRLIEIDAVVTDRRGNPVSGLTPEDFELLENGRPQVITNFTAYQDGEDVTGAASGEAGPSGAGIKQPRAIVILVDALPLRGRARRTLFADLHAIVERTMREGDRAQVLTWHDRQGMRPLTPMTLARAEVIAALATAEETLHPDPDDLTLAAEVQWMREEEATADPQGGPPLDGETHVQASVRMAAGRELSVMRRKTAAIQRVLAAIGEPAQRSVLIYVSGGFPMVAGKKFFSSIPSRLGFAAQEEYSTGAMLEAITRTANAHGAVVYALRPDIAAAGASRIRNNTTSLSLELPASTTLGAGGAADRTFAEPPSPHLTDMIRDQTLLQNDVQALGLVTRETGGSLAVGTAAIKAAVEGISRDLGSYYTLAYRVTADGSDRERRIEVRPKNRGHAVRTRRTILDRSDATRARDLLVARLFERGSEGDIQFDIETGAARPGESNQLLIPIELTIPVEQLQFEAEGDQLAARFSVLLVAGANIGQVTRLMEKSQRIVARDGEAPSGVVRHRFELLSTPAPLNVSIAVFDEKSGLAGTQSILVEGGEVQGETVLSGPLADTAWRQTLTRANEERKPIVIYFRPVRCSVCERFERESLTHPAIQRRLSEVVFARLPPTAGELSRLWKSRSTGLAVFDRLGRFQLSFDGAPDTATFGVILDDISDVAPHLERAAVAIENGEPHEGELDTAIALIMLGQRNDARAALDRAIQNARPETRQYARVAVALLDSQDGRGKSAMQELDRIIAGALTPHIAGEAWLTLGLIHQRNGATDEAFRALATARGLLGRDSRIAATSESALAALETPQSASGTIRILPPDGQVISGRLALSTTVASADVVAVAFTLDDIEVERIRRPPFVATIDLGRVPEQRRVGAIAFDSLGNEAGRDEITLNEGGERFWFRITEPQEGTAGGRTDVKMILRSPPNQEVQQVTVSWNEEVRAVVTAPPWETSVRIPPGQIGVLRGVAQLADGRVAEDAVLLNGRGKSERADVQLVELPVTVSGAEAGLVTSEIVVREGGMRRIADSIQDPASAPLTVGIVIDTSGSMKKTLAEVQEAAIGFLEGVLGDRDRAFIVSFATRARLVQPPTTDKTLLTQNILSLRSGGSTALYDAIAVGLLQLQGVKGRRALVVFTDGADRTSRYGAVDVAGLARRTHVPIHLIATAADRSVPNMPGSASAALNWGVMYRALSRMAQSTGGSAQTLERLDDLPQVYERIGSALRSQFLVFVRAEPGTSENDWRNIKVEIAARGVTVHAPEGYYAPW